MQRALKNLQGRPCVRLTPSSHTRLPGQLSKSPGSPRPPGREPWVRICHLWSPTPRLPEGVTPHPVLPAALAVGVTVPVFIDEETAASPVAELGLKMYCPIPFLVLVSQALILKRNTRTGSIYEARMFTECSLLCGELYVHLRPSPQPFEGGVITAGF